MYSLLLAAAVSTQAYTPVVSMRAGQWSQLRLPLRRARALVSLDKQDVLEKLNVVPVFAVANGAGQIMSTVSEFAETAAPVITFYLDIADAKRSLAFASADDPGVELTVAPLGMALTMKSSDVTVQVQPSQAEYNSIRADLGFSSADESEGEMKLIPLFYSDELKFESSSDPDDPRSIPVSTNTSSTPFFFEMADYRAAWVASGLASDELPAVQLMDLRKLAYQMEHDAADAWRSSVLIPSEAGIEFIKARGYGTRGYGP